VGGEGGDGGRGRAAFVRRAVLLATRSRGRGVGIGGLGLGTRHWIWLDAMGHLLRVVALEVVVRRGVEVLVSVGRRRGGWGGKLPVARTCLWRADGYLRCWSVPWSDDGTTESARAAFKQTGTYHPNMAQDNDSYD
jgi:hypothetical protein